MRGAAVSPYVQCVVWCSGVIPAVAVFISINSQHEVSQHLRPEGGRDDDVSAFGQNLPQKHRARVYVRRCGHVLLSDEVMDSILPVQLNLGATEFKVELLLMWHII